MLCEDDPLHVIFTPRAQGIVCLGCLVAFWPRQLLPWEPFVLIGKQFVRAHRFCKPAACFATLQQVLPAVVSAEPREPGCEG